VQNLQLVIKTPVTLVKEKPVEPVDRSGNPEAVCIDDFQPPDNAYPLEKPLTPGKHIPSLANELKEKSITQVTTTNKTDEGLRDFNPKPNPNWHNQQWKSAEDIMAAGKRETEIWDEMLMLGRKTPSEHKKNTKAIKRQYTSLMEKFLAKVAVTGKLNIRLLAL